MQLEFERLAGTHQHDASAAAYLSVFELLSAGLPPASMYAMKLPCSGVLFPPMSLGQEDRSELAIDLALPVLALPVFH